MLRINDTITLADWELSESFTRSSGPGGQNVNKVSTAVELRFEAGRCVEVRAAAGADAVRAEMASDANAPFLGEADDFDPSGVTVVTQDPEVVLPSEPIEDAPDEEAAAEPVDAGVAPEESENDVLLDDEGFETGTQEDADALDDTDDDLPYIHDEDLENVDADDSDETEDLPEGFEPAPAVQEEPTQDEDPAQP